LSSQGNKDKKFLDAVRKETNRSILLRLIEAFATVLNNLIRFGWPVAIVWVLTSGWVRSAPSLAGQTTRVEVLGKVVTDIAANRWFYMLVIAILGGTVHVQRKAYKKRVANLSAQNVNLEKMIDSRRTSSGLRTDGSRAEK